MITLYHTYNLHFYKSIASLRLRDIRYFSKKSSVLNNMWLAEMPASYKDTAIVVGNTKIGRLLNVSIIVE